MSHTEIIYWIQELKGNDINVSGLPIFRNEHTHLVCQVRSAAGGPSEVSERWHSTQRPERHTEAEATSSGSSAPSGARPWLPTAPRTAPPAAHRFCESSLASWTARCISPPPSPPPSPASSQVFPASSSGVEWTCSAEFGPQCTTGPAGGAEN